MHLVSFTAADCFTLVKTLFEGSVESVAFEVEAIKVGHFYEIVGADPNSPPPTKVQVEELLSAAQKSACAVILDQIHEITELTMKVNVLPFIHSRLVNKPASLTQLQQLMRDPFRKEVAKLLEMKTALDKLQATPTGAVAKSAPLVRPIPFESDVERILGRLDAYSAALLNTCPISSSQDGALLVEKERQVRHLYSQSLLSHAVKIDRLMRDLDTLYSALKGRNPALPQKEYDEVLEGLRRARDATTAIFAKRPKAATATAEGTNGKIPEDTIDVVTKDEEITANFDAMSAELTKVKVFMEQNGHLMHVGGALQTKYKERSYGQRNALGVVTEVMATASGHKKAFEQLKGLLEAAKKPSLPTQIMGIIGGSFAKNNSSIAAKKGGRRRR